MKDDYTHVRVTRPFGAVQVMPLAAYEELPEDAVWQTHAELLTRADVLRLRHAEVRR